MNSPCSTLHHDVAPESPGITLESRKPKSFGNIRGAPYFVDTNYEQLKPPWGGADFLATWCCARRRRGGLLRD
jgi:hypothetical protein